jgi:hypothetical protein
MANATAMTSGGDDDDGVSMGTVSALLMQHEDGDESDAAEWLLEGAPPAHSVGVTATTALAEAAAARGDWDGYVASAEAEAASLML